ncbi:hypothetical protein BCR42DRAFT_390055 [Absidia repens]|uniref:Uncharacterized protein n=1 Tax=Absidia repens TaxID=90262 RepID=A0A1X2IMX8_9FUNG|nr:hypothetical protein BCR42DRAFT_390055 [Absidia repens]
MITSHRALPYFGRSFMLLLWHVPYCVNSLVNISVCIPYSMDNKNSHKTKEFKVKPTFWNPRVPIHLRVSHEQKTVKTITTTTTFNAGKASDTFRTESTTDSIRGPFCLK